MASDYSPLIPGTERIMGLTIHYNVSVPKNWTRSKILDGLGAVHDYAVELGFREVTPVAEFQGNECDFRWIREQGLEKEDRYFWSKIQAQRHVESPWKPGQSDGQAPNRMFVFNVWPTYGSEEMNIGVCSYPRMEIKPEKELTYMAWSYVNKEQAKVLKAFLKRWNLRKLPHRKNGRWRDNPVRKCYFDIHGWVRADIVGGQYQSHRKGYAANFGRVAFRDQQEGSLEFKYQGTVEEAEKCFANPLFQQDCRDMAYGKEHVIPAAFGEWGSFCKTQYANDPKCGGWNNFAFAHLGVIAVLDKMKELGFVVKVSDEGGYWEKRDLGELAKEIQQWDAMIAGLGGMLKDMTPDGMALETAMDKRSDFERLEMFAHQDPKLGDMLKKIRSSLPTLVDEV